MADEQKAAASAAPSAPPRREGGGGHGGQRWRSFRRRTRPWRTWPRRRTVARVVKAAPAAWWPGGPRRGKRQYFRKKKVCKFCVEKMDFIDYKRADILSQFVQERGKILPRRMTGVCARHQRWLGEAIKRARNIALAAVRRKRCWPQAPRRSWLPVQPAAQAATAPRLARPRLRPRQQHRPRRLLRTSAPATPAPSKHRSRRLAARTAWSPSRT